jgi:hypothetical protein
MDLDPQVRLPPSAFDHPREARGGKRGSSLTDKRSLGQSRVDDDVRLEARGQLAGALQLSRP